MRLLVLLAAGKNSASSGRFADDVVNFSARLMVLFRKAAMVKHTACADPTSLNCPSWHRRSKFRH